VSAERARTLAPFGRRVASVSAVRRLGAYTILHCADAAGPRPDAGQFYMLATETGWGGGAGQRPFLPRAFSVLRTGPEGELQFLLEAVGPGTARLAELAPGEGLWLAGPFGLGFAPPPPGFSALLVGGGVGIAPLAIWGDQLGPGPRVLLGFRGAAHARGAELLPGAEVATDDGSVGHAGPVTELLEAVLSAEPARWAVSACGPAGMLEAVRALCARRAVPAQLALESGMACGFGACFGCVVPTRDGLLRLCVDGPVLDGARLEHVDHPGGAT